MIIKFLKKYFFIILAVLIGVGGYFYIRAVGREYTHVRKDIVSRNTISKVYVEEDTTGLVEILDWEKTDDSITVRVKGIRPGRSFVMIEYIDGTFTVFPFMVHKNCVVSYDRFFGDTTGSGVVIACIGVYLILLAVFFIRKYRKSVKESLYRYDNILYLGLIIFIFYLVYSQITAIIYKSGIGGALSSAAGCTQSFVLFTWPVVVITTVVVTVSNIQLIRKEGRSWRNLLGLFLGLFLGIGSLLPIFIGNMLFYSKVIDVHYERGFGRFFELFLENTVSAYVAYLECILIGTIIVAVKAALRIPSFDKDYIIIHGCQIRKDGTLTKLLQSRADRAVEFAKMQKDKTGKDIVFIPSGGKGSDEVISEGEAIAQYLKEQGISEDKILLENESTSTEENIKFAKKKLEEHSGSAEYKAAFATTNYHVFRTGMLAEKSGLKAEGIGSKTKVYFWVNAFVREFIATIVNEKKTHARVALILFLVQVASILMMYVSEAILS